MSQYWQADHDRPLIDNDAPSWAHHLAEISAILLETRSTLDGNGIKHRREADITDPGLGRLNWADSGRSR